MARGRIDGHVGAVSRISHELLVVDIAYTGIGTRAVTPVDARQINCDHEDRWWRAKEGKGRGESHLESGERERKHTSGRPDQHVVHRRVLASQPRPRD